MGAVPASPNLLLPCPGSVLSLSLRTVWGKALELKDTVQVGADEVNSHVNRVLVCKGR